MTQARTECDLPPASLVLVLDSWPPGCPVCPAGVNDLPGRSILGTGRVLTSRAGASLGLFRWTLTRSRQGPPRGLPKQGHCHTPPPATCESHWAGQTESWSTLPAVREAVSPNPTFAVWRIHSRPAMFAEALSERHRSSTTVAGAAPPTCPGPAHHPRPRPLLRRCAARLPLPTPQPGFRGFL